MTEPTTVKVLMSRELMEQWTSRDIHGNRLHWAWGEPDQDDCYTPTITVDYDDNIAAAERERLRLIADEYARKSAPPHDSARTLHEAWEWVRDVFLADPEATDR